jgi:hypothetical protein
VLAYRQGVDLMAAQAQQDFDKYNQVFSQSCHKGTFSPGNKPTREGKPRRKKTLEGMLRIIWQFRTGHCEDRQLLRPTLGPTVTRSEASVQSTAGRVPITMNMSAPSCSIQGVSCLPACATARQLCHTGM